MHRLDTYSLKFKELSIEIPRRSIEEHAERISSPSLRHLPYLPQTSDIYLHWTSFHYCETIVKESPTRV